MSQLIFIFLIFWILFFYLFVLFIYLFYTFILYIYFFFIHLFSIFRRPPSAVRRPPFAVRIRRQFHRLTDTLWLKWPELIERKWFSHVAQSKFRFYNSRYITTARGISITYFRTFYSRFFLKSREDVCWLSRMTQMTSKSTFSLGFIYVHILRLCCHFT